LRFERAARNRRGSNFPMIGQFLAPKFLVLYAILASALYIHLRGRERFRFTRQLFNHSTLLAPYNALVFLFSGVPAKAFQDVKQFPDLAPLRDNWMVLREEAQRLFDQGHIGTALANNDVGFNSFFKRGWKRFYVKWYGDPLASAEALCPKTVALLAKFRRSRPRCSRSSSPAHI
jgi:beta-hydroxylase